MKAKRKVSKSRKPRNKKPRKGLSLAVAVGLVLAAAAAGGIGRAWLERQGGAHDEYVRHSRGR